VYTDCAPCIQQHRESWGRFSVDSAPCIQQHRESCSRFSVHRLCSMYTAAQGELEQAQCTQSVLPVYSSTGCAGAGSVYTDSAPCIQQHRESCSRFSVHRLCSLYTAAQGELQQVQCTQTLLHVYSSIGTAGAGSVYTDCAPCIQQHRESWSRFSVHRLCSMYTAAQGELEQVQCTQTLLPVYSSTRRAGAGLVYTDSAPCIQQHKESWSRFRVHRLCSMYTAAQGEREQFQCTQTVLPVYSSTGRAGGGSVYTDSAPCIQQYRLSWSRFSVHRLCSMYTVA